MRSARALLVATATAAAVVLSGCSSTVVGSPVAAQGASGATTDANPGGTGTGGAGAPSAAPADATTWTNNVCGSLLPFVKASTTQPQISQSDPAAAVKSFSAYLGQSISAIDESLGDLDAVGPAPVAGGETIVSKLKDTLTTVRTSFAKSKDIVDKVDPNDPQQLATQLPQALAPLQDLQSLKNPLDDLKVDPTLDAAANNAPNCQTLNKMK